MFSPLDLSAPEPQTNSESPDSPQRTQSSQRVLTRPYGMTTLELNQIGTCHRDVVTIAEAREEGERL